MRRLFFLLSFFLEFVVTALEIIENLRDCFCCFFIIFQLIFLFFPCVEIDLAISRAACVTGSSFLIAEMFAITAYFIFVLFVHFLRVFEVIFSEFCV